MSERPVILVVDDDQPILLLMRNLLREFGFEPVVASSGPEAVEKAHQRTPDLILLDLNMPGMSGDQVLREIRSSARVPHIPILIVSGEPVGRTELEHLGASAAILKPFDLAVLVETIRKHLN